MRRRMRVDDLPLDLLRLISTVNAGPAFGHPPGALLLERLEWNRGRDGRFTVDFGIVRHRMLFEGDRETADWSLIAAAEAPPKGAR